MNDTSATLGSLIIALGLGLLVGLERERAASPLGGVRTFALITVLGAVCGLLAVDFGGWVVDTPGVRQFQLWDIIPEEVEGFFPEFRPWVPLCAFPDCTHTHEERCAIKRAVTRGQISEQRYVSYLGLFSGEEAG